LQTGSFNNEAFRLKARLRFFFYEGIMFWLKLFLPLVASLFFTLPLQPSPKRIIKTGPALGLPFSPAVQAGDLIYVSGTMATDAQGKLVAGTIKEQTKRTLENIAQVLKAAGSSLDRAASVHVYLKNASDFEAMNEAYRTFWPKDPPVRTTIVAGLVLPDALIEISLTALRRNAERKVILPAGWQPSANYSYGIQSGDTLFLAGLVARDNQTNTQVTGEMAVQTKQVLDNAGAILKAAGMSHADVVSSRVYITDTTKFQEMNAAYRAYFPMAPPARATVRAALMNAQYAVEITLLAVKSSDRQAILPLDENGKATTPNPNLSAAIRAGNRLYLSGMLGNTPDNKDDANAQSQRTLAALGRGLKAAGFDWRHVVEGLVYLTDVKHYGAMNEAYRAQFGKDFPARATVVTGLVAPDGMVEIMLTAVK
jgi:2-iminobutanoate/2-iminopropanoate deaminase